MSNYYKMGNVKVRDFDVNNYVKTDDDIQALLDVAAKDENAEHFIAVVNELVRKRSMKNDADNFTTERELKNFVKILISLVFLKLKTFPKVI